MMAKGSRRPKALNLWLKFRSGARSDRNQMRQVLRIWPPAALPLTPQP